MHPFGSRGGGGCHDRDIRGPGCSVRSSSAAWPAHAETRAHPGLGDPSRLVTAPGLEPGVEVMAAGLAARSASVSRCQARARSLRAIAVVAIFLPRRRAMAWELAAKAGGRLAVCAASPQNHRTQAAPR